MVVKKKGRMLCDLAIGTLEEISSEFAFGILKWKVVDVSDREGLERYEELARRSGILDLSEEMWQAFP